jgi:hypothetical protein
MAKHSAHILDMARIGAQHKYQELKAELAALIKNFPHLVDQSPAHGRSAGPLDRVAMRHDPAPIKRNLSAKARKAISDAQKRRWAKARGAAKG